MLCSESKDMPILFPKVKKGVCYLGGNIPLRDTDGDQGLFLIKRIFHKETHSLH